MFSKRGVVLGLLTLVVVDAQVYVSSLGSDQAACGEMGTPCASLSYALTLTTASVVLLPGRHAGPSNRNLIITSPVIIRARDSDRTKTIVDCQRQGRCLDVVNTKLILEGITFTGGALSFTNYSNVLQVQQSQRQHNYFRHDVAKTQGEGEAVPPVDRAPFVRNASPRRTLVTNPLVSGGIIAAHSSTLEISNCAFEGSSAAQGGAIFAVDSAVHLVSSSVVGNSGNHGGGLAAHGGSVVLNRTHFERNQVVNSGRTTANYNFYDDFQNIGVGAAVLLNTTTATLEACSFESNLCSAAATEDFPGLSVGGAIAAWDCQATITSSTFMQNGCRAHCFVSNYCVPGVRGGTLFLEGTNLTVSDSIFLRSFLFSPSHCYGGVVCLSPSASAGPTNNLTVVDSVMGSVTVQVPGQYGAHSYGAVLNAEDAVVSFVRCDLSNNSGIGARTGLGVIRVDNSVLTMSDVVSSNNYLEGGRSYARGGSLEVAFRSLVSISRCVFSNNTLRSADYYYAGVKGGSMFITGSSARISDTRMENNVIFGLENSRGGSIFAYDSVVNITGCTLANNSVSGDDSASGGGLYVEGGTILVEGCRIHDNRVHSAVVGNGGGVSVDEGLVNVSSTPIFNNDVDASDVAAGGGLYVATSKGTLDLFNLTIANNRVARAFSAWGGGLSAAQGVVTADRTVVVGNLAGVGGGVHVSGETRFTAVRSSFMRNSANGVGGGLVALGGSKLALDSSLVSINNALEATQVLAYGQPSLRVTASTVEGRDSIFCVLQGSISVFESTVWRSVFPGHEVDLKSTNNSAVVTFSRCPEGSYLLARSTSMDPLRCSSCPQGADCRGGSNVSARAGFWGQLTLDTRVLEMHRCPTGYCCADSACSPYNYCNADRAGRLCGECRPGYSLVVLGVGCAADSTCNNLSWLLPVALGISLAFALYQLNGHREGAVAIHQELHAQMDTEVDAKTSDGRPSGPAWPADGGELKTVIFFFQITPLLLTATTLDNQTDFFQILLSVFNLKITNGPPKASTRGWCPFAGFSPLQKQATSYLIPFLLICWVVLAYVVQRCVQISSFQLLLKKHHLTSAILGALFSITGLAYSTLVGATFSLINCVKVGDDLVLFDAGSTECYQPWQIAVFVLVLPLLLLYPAFLAGMVRWVLAKPSPTVALLSIQRSIDLPYQHQGHPLQRLWESVLMLERLVLILITTFVPNPVWRAWLSACCLVLMLALHLTWRPFKRRLPNDLMTAFLCFAVVLASWEVGTNDRSWFGIPGHAHLDAFSHVSAVLLTLPFCLGVLLQYQGRFAQATSFVFERILKKPPPELGRLRLWVSRDDVVQTHGTSAYDVSLELVQLERVGQHKGQPHDDEFGWQEDTRTSRC